MRGTIASLNDYNLDGIQSKNDLIESAKVFMDYLFQFVPKKNFIVVLTDCDAKVIEIVGGNFMLKMFQKELDFSEGSHLSKKFVGKTAINLALSHRKPVQLCGEEHENDSHKEFSCYAAPIEYGDELLGSLCITEHSRTRNENALGMVIASAKGIENLILNKKKANKIAQQSQYQNAIVENISEGVLTIDKHGTLTYINQKAIETLGFESDTCIGKNISDLVPFKPIILEVLETGQGYVDREYILTNRKGQSVHLLKTAMPIRDHDGNLTGVIDIFREIEYYKKIVNKLVGARANFVFDDLIGESGVFKSCIEHAMKAAKTSSNVLIQGESGTGKELFAHSIHNHSSRKDKPFVAINCAAIPKELIESELFGYAKGSFTGGVKGGRPGKFELANGGTIFLDEIGEMPIEIQAKLLRVLQDKKVVRVGGESVFDVDVRIIAATNKNLYEESKKGNFRWDIYYRLNVLSITIPPLRERIEDVPLIVDSLIKRINKRLGTYVSEIDSKVVSELMKNNWKGNVRELENVLERMINMCGKTKITLEQLPSEYKGLRKNNLATKDYDHKSYEEHERELLITALSYFEGNVSQAARSLKISRNTLYNKMDKFGLNA